MQYTIHTINIDELFRLLLVTEVTPVELSAGWAAMEDLLHRFLPVNLKEQEALPDATALLNN